MTSDQLAAIEARLRAATPGPWTNDMREVWTANGTHCICDAYVDEIESGECSDATFIANAPADIAALIAVYKDAARERDKVRMLFDSKDASLVAIARERDEARAQLEAVTRDKERYRAALHKVAYTNMSAFEDIEVAREALQGTK